MKYFELEQINATGNGSSRTVMLVTNPVFDNGGIRAMKVGIPDWDKTFEAMKQGDKNTYYNQCPAVEVLVAGNAICNEVKHPYFLSNDKGHFVDVVV